MRVLGNIEKIVREEMDSLGAHEVLLPNLQSREIWDATGRWDEVDVLYRIRSRAGADFCLSATAEEAVTRLATDLLGAYRGSDAAVFQIGTKFRDELRARSGLLRGREFRMKDMYSFHADAAGLDEFYDRAVAAYRRLFDRIGIGDRVVYTAASGGVFSRYSHEFQLLSEAGEDTIFLDESTGSAVNRELVQDEEAMVGIFGAQRSCLSEHRAIEVGNIFKLGVRFSSALGLSMRTAGGTATEAHMGCYGIGTSRLIGALAEIFHDSKGLTWPAAVAPYDIHIVQLAGRELGARVLKCFEGEGDNVLVDDRQEIRAGEKFTDADLIGIPIRVTVGKAAVKSSEVDITTRRDGGQTRVSIERLRDTVSDIRSAIS
jgi:prolyl-tRNA synthetase